MLTTELRVNINPAPESIIDIEKITTIILVKRTEIEWASTIRVNRLDITKCGPDITL